MEAIADWAARMFGRAELGDARRSARAVLMLRRAAKKPSGHVSSVYRSPAERQAAYDLLENAAIAPEGLTHALSRAAARAAAAHERVYIPFDGTSLAVTDTQEAKGLGRIGAYAKGATGLKLLNAIALAPDGRFLGIAEQIWWARQQRVRSKKANRAPQDRESVHWRTCVERIHRTFGEIAPKTKLHFLADREADATLLMKLLVEKECEFTIRSNATRVLAGPGTTIDVRRALQRTKPLTTMTIAIAHHCGRPARTAVLEIRAKHLQVRVRDRQQRRESVLSLTFVAATERGGGLDWVLATNVCVSNAEQACDVVRLYTRRWRIEDFHRTWKSGHCKVEQTQLRSRGAIIKWATILSAVASRAEQLRQRHRIEPNAPASTAFSDDEIQAIVALKTRIKTRVEKISADGMTIETAVRWVAEIGGHTGKRNGPPGATTIGRGLAELDVAAALLAHLRMTGRLR